MTSDELIETLRAFSRLSSSPVRPSPDFMGEVADALAAAQEEIERLREALECGKNLIEGEAVGAEWKKKCLCFIRKANTALGKEG